jgi:Rrf2 family protein
MAANTRFSTGVHALVLLALEPSALQTSEIIAGKLATNPVVIRRVFSMLRQAQLVTSHKGPSGGSQLARPPKDITLKDIYQALEPSSVFHETTIAGEAAELVSKELSRAFKAAESGLLDALAETSLHSIVKRANRKQH